MAENFCLQLSPTKCGGEGTIGITIHQQNRGIWGKDMEKFNRVINKLHAHTTTHNAAINIYKYIYLGTNHYPHSTSMPCSSPHEWCTQTLQPAHIIHVSYFLPSLGSEYCTWHIWQGVWSPAFALAADLALAADSALAADFFVPFFLDAPEQRIATKYFTI